MLNPKSTGEKVLWTLEDELATTQPLPDTGKDEKKTPKASNFMWRDFECFFSGIE